MVKILTETLQYVLIITVRLLLLFTEQLDCCGTCEAGEECCGWTESPVWTERPPYRGCGTHASGSHQGKTTHFKMQKLGKSNGTKNQPSFATDKIVRKIS